MLTEQIASEEIEKMALSREIDELLNTRGFNPEKYLPVLVQFKNYDGFYSGKKYIYLLPTNNLIISLPIKEHILVVPAKGNFEIVKIASDLDNKEDLIFIKKQLKKNLKVKTVVTCLGNENNGILKEHYDREAKVEKANQLIKDMEERAKIINKMKMFEKLSKEDPDMNNLLKEYKELEF